MRTIIATATAIAVIMAAAAAQASGNGPPVTPPGHNKNANSNVNANVNANTNVNANLNRVNNVNRQMQGQGQFQGQGQTLNNANTLQNGSPSATINNTTPATTFAHVSSYADGNVWSQPAASAVAPSVYAASICQSAISGAAQVPLFGISFGSVQGLDVCIKLMLAEQARTEGRGDVATFFKCQTKEFREAYKATGTPCPADMPKTSPTMAQAAPAFVGPPAPQWQAAQTCVDRAGNPVPVGTAGAVRCQ